MKKFLSFILTAVLLCSVFTAFPKTELALAAYYNTYSDVAAVPNANSCGSMQGMAIGSTYIYTIKRDDNDANCVIHKIARTSGNKVQLKNSANGNYTVSGMGHANDACLTVIDGVENMFVVTMVAGTNNLWQLSLSGDYYTVKKKFSIKVDGSSVGMSGVDIISVSDGKINFLFKKGASFYKGSLSTSAATGTVINATKSFAINVSSVNINGTTTDLSSYTYQGFGYYNDMVFVPVTNENVSIIIVYSGVSVASGTIKSKSDLSFRITSSTYSALFEMESCGIGPDGLLYFNTNRRKSSSDTNHDGVHYFENFNFSSLATGTYSVTAPAEIDVGETAAVSWTAPTHVIKYNYSAVLNNNGVKTTLASKTGTTSKSFTVPAVTEGDSITVTVDAVGPVDTKTVTKTININNPVPSDITASDTNIKKDLTDDGYFKGFKKDTSVADALSKFAQDKAYLQIRDRSGNVIADTGVLCTGYTVNIVDGTNVKKSYTIVVTGDCNGDGTITSSDYISQMSHITGASTMIGAFLLAGDVNGDNSLSASDYASTLATLQGN